MKKFQFTLATLKKYNDQIFETEKNTLGALRKELIDLEEKQRLNLIALDAAQTKKTDMCIKGTTPVDLIVQQRYISELQLEAHNLVSQISKKENEIEIQQQRVVDANKEVTKLEKLEEKQLEEYREKEKKEQEALIEEFISNSSQPNK